MPHFRHRAVKEWRIFEDTNKHLLCAKLNDLMKEYIIEDCQYSVHVVKNRYSEGYTTFYTALVLVGEKVGETSDETV
jgi:hypothetical protein